MPNHDYLPDTDAKLLQWLGTFTAVAQANKAALKLSVADVQTIVTDTTQFNNGVRAAVNARIAAKAATQTRAAARRKAVKDTRALVKRIQATPGVTDAMKTELGITVARARRAQVPVFQPTVPTAVMQPDLSVLVQWDGSGNTYRTAFVVERQLGADGAWATVKTVTATRFVDRSVPPGAPATYRVTATRGRLTSLPSAETSVYPKAASASAKAASVNAQAA